MPAPFFIGIAGWGSFGCSQPSRAIKASRRETSATVFENPGMGEEDSGLMKVSKGEQEREQETVQVVACQTEPLPEWPPRFAQRSSKQAKTEQLSSPPISPYMYHS